MAPCLDEQAVAGAKAPSRAAGCGRGERLELIKAAGLRMAAVIGASECALQLLRLLRLRQAWRYCTVHKFQRLFCGSGGAGGEVRDRSAEALRPVLHLMHLNSCAAAERVEILSATL